MGKWSENVHITSIAEIQMKDGIMYTITAPIAGTEKTVTHPVTQRVIMDIINFLNIPKNALVENHIMTSDFVNKNYNVSRHSRRQTFLASAKVTFTYVEEVEDMDLVTMDILQTPNGTCMLEYPNGFKVENSAVNTTIKIQANFKTKNESEASSTLAQLKSLVMLGETSLRHDFDIRYYMDDSIRNFIYSIKKQLDTKYGKILPTEDFFNFIKRDGTGVSLPITGDMSKSTITYTQRHTDIEGHFDNLQGMEMTYDNDTGYYSIDISYHIKITKPLFEILTYHSVIDNLVIDDEYLDLSNENIYEELTCYEDNFDILKFIDKLNGIEKEHKYLRIPSFDSSTLKADGKILLSVLATSEQGELFNFNDMGDYRLNKYLLEYMKINVDLLTKPFSNPVLVSLHVNGVLKRDGLVIDEDLNVSLKEFNSNDRYQVTLSVIEDTKFLSPVYKNGMEDSIKLIDNRRAIVNDSLLKLSNNTITNTFGDVMKKLLDYNDEQDYTLYTKTGDAFTILNMELHALMDTYEGMSTIMETSSSNVNLTHIEDIFSLYNMSIDLTFDTVEVKNDEEWYAKNGTVEVCENSIYTIIKMNGETHIIIDEYLLTFTINNITVRKDGVIEKLKDMECKLSFLNSYRFSQDPTIDRWDVKTVQISNIIALRR